MEASLVHGAISCGTLTVGTLTLPDGSTLVQPDTVLNSTSTNPAASKLALDAVTAINAVPEAAFSIHLVSQTPSSSTGAITFDSTVMLMNEFSSGGLNGSKNGVVIPTNGVYHLSSTTQSVFTHNTISMTLANRTSSAESYVEICTSRVLAKDDIVQLVNNNATQSSSVLKVTLIKAQI